MSADAIATRSATHSPDQLECNPMEIQDPADFNAEPIPDKISAYYSLVFSNYTYYLQTTSVTIGRRAVRNSAGASTSDTTQADVDLGALKSVSRLHARIEYEEENERYVLVILGRNGAWVDGIWSGSGSRVPLGARSSIQIASRTFHFILPPSPPPEDSPSPSSPGSSTRQLSPSIDITSLSPASSPPSPLAGPPKLPPPKPEPVEPPIPPVNGKKRKKPDPEARKPVPVPEVMPPRPSFTYAQLCNRAIKDLGGKATLQDICHWISDNHDWYRYNEGKTGWESSVRHNLSSNRAFKKLEKSVGERGKGYLWSVDPNFEHLLKEQTSKAPWTVNGGVENSKNKGKGKNGKNGIPTESPLKRSVKGEPNSPLPPPLKSSPLPPFTTQPSSTLSQSSSVPTTSEPISVTSTSTSTPQLIPLSKEPSATITASTTTITSPLTSATLQPQTASSSQSTAGTTPLNLQDIKVPIVLDATPFTSTDVSESTSGDALTTHFKTSPIALRGDKIALNPAIFGDLTSSQLRELESLGTKKAIEILQGYIVKFLKERIKAEGAKGKGKSKGKTKTKSKKDKSKEGEPQQDKGESTAPDSVENAVGNAGKQERVAQKRDGNNNIAGVSGSTSTSRSRKVDTSVTPFTTVPLPSRTTVTAPATTPLTSVTINGQTAPHIAMPNYAPMPNPYLHPYSYATLNTTHYVGVPANTAPTGDSKLVAAPSANVTAETKPPIAASLPPASKSPPPMAQLAEEDGSSGDFIDIENDEPDTMLSVGNDLDNDGPAPKKRRVGEAEGVPVAVA